jgi:hypothetical protein
LDCFPSDGALASTILVEDHAPEGSPTKRGGAAMPIVFARFPIATAPEIEQFRDDPRGLAERVRQIVEGIEGVRLVDLYFDVGRPVAYAVVEGLDDFRDMAAVSSYLGAEDLVKAIRVEDAVAAVERKRAVRDRLPTSDESRH